LWYTSVIPALERLRQEDCEFKAGMDYVWKPCLKKTIEARRQWLMPVILTTQEAEIKKIMVPSQPGQIVCKTLSQKNPIRKKGW
jgi:hypothetical protein